MESIKNINDLVKALQFDTLEELENYLGDEVYPVTLTHNEEGIKLVTDADRVPFDKILRFPFSENDFDNALSGLQCVTDYAMHEGYKETHKDLFDQLALRHAEDIGVYEYKVNGQYMEYWSLFDEGFYFFRTDLNTLEREEVCHLHWAKGEGYPVPAFLLTDGTGFTKYNYFCG